MEMVNSPKNLIEVSKMRKGIEDPRRNWQPKFSGLQQPTMATGTKLPEINNDG